jgi:phenylacetaldehyde dehydrogenase
LLQSGVIWANTATSSTLPPPFVGYEQSSYGREMGHAVLDAHAQVKTAWISLR